jgi:transcriptional regulator GlxA family with amidase domain
MKLEELRRFGFLTLPSYSMIACANAIEALRMANRVSGQAFSPGRW